MKSVLVVALAIGLVAPVASGAIYYEFHQSTHSDDENKKPVDLTGRAIIEGSRSRVEFLAGNAFIPGSYVIGNGSRLFTIVDPASKTFAEVNAAASTTTLGSVKMKVENLKWNVQKLDDHPIYAGIPTDHYQLVLTYDLTVMMGALPVKQAIRAEIDKWTTVQFGDVAETFLANSGLRTGNPEIDKLIEIETGNIKGFALRQSIRVTATASTPTAAQSRRGDHPFQFRPVRTSKREIVVTAIREAPANESLFAVPVTYKRAQPNPKSAPQTQVEILSLEPSGK